MNANPLRTSSRELLALGVFGAKSRLGERIGMLLERGREFSPRVSRTRMAASAAALLGCVAAGSLAPRMVAFAQAELRFAASSIRPAAPQPRGEQFMGFAPGPGGGLRGREVSLLSLIGYAYNGDGPRAPMVGAPGWANADEYDVVAAPEPGANPPSKDQLREMTRNMLADRFKLAVHRETRETPVYALTVAKNGPKLQREQAEPPADPPGGSCSVGRKPMCTWTAQKASMVQLVMFLGQLGRPVIDRTGLTGEFDFRLKYDAQWRGPEPPPDEMSRLPIRDAIEQQFGLKIEDSKGPVEVLVIDHAEKPDAN
jgi:uncharacterized protein (TIGR03435 family)